MNEREYTYLKSNWDLTEIQVAILNVKPSRWISLQSHLRRGGKVKTFLPFLIGDGYSGFWKTRKRYRVVKGSRASKKTVTTARNFIWNMMKYPESNLLVVRKVMRTNKDSTWADLKKAINDLGVSHLWKTTTSPLEITYKPTGQKILFRGLDDPMKISGVTVPTGHLNWVWIEEGYEMKTEAELDFIDESIRGLLPDHLWYQITITLNPWNKKHWIKERFFDPIYGVNEEFRDTPREVADTFAITTNYLMNEFIDESFIAKMLSLKKRNPKRYNVAGLGNWGVSEGVIFEQYREEEFDPQLIIRRRSAVHFTGLDFGWTDPVAMVAGIVDPDAMRIYIYDEIYREKLSNRKLVALMKQKQLQNSIVVAENANPKDIEDLFSLGIRRVRPAIKGKGSILAGIRNIQDYEVVVHPNCINFITELENYIWDPDKADTPVDAFNHLMDAWRYGMESVAVAKPKTNKAMVFK